MNPGLYLHVPFCSAICPYCDFAVLVAPEERRRRFADLLIAESAQAAADGFEGFDTLYLGGGTPSLLEPDDLARLLEGVRRNLPIEDRAQISLEANPEDVTRERLAAWRELGVQVVSLGVQSFDAGELAFLGRRHTAEQSRASLELTLAAGFDTVSADLIYGLPEQSAGAWRRNLEAAIALGPDHLSCYQLTLHRKTRFGALHARGELAEFPEEAQAELFLLTHRFLGERGFPGYEVSSFAAALEHRSRHNMKYWDHTPYLGLGPSAHSFDGRTRWWNVRKLASYERRLAAGERPREESEELSREALILERLMLGFRTCEGVDLERLRRRHGLDLRARNGERIERLAAEGLLIDAGSSLRPTLSGLAVADSLAAAFEI